MSQQWEFVLQWACVTYHEHDAVQLSSLWEPSQDKLDKPTSPENAFGTAGQTYVHIFKSN